MINLNLTKQELFCLSTFSKIPINRTSPLFDNNVEEIFDFNDGVYYNAYENMRRDGFLKGEEKDEKLVQEFEPLFFILHSPEFSLHFKKLGGNISETKTFVFKKSFGAFIEENRTNSFYSITYPYAVQNMKQWIENTLLGNYSFKEPPIPPYNLSMNFDESLIMDIIISILKNRVLIKQGPLTKMEAVVGIDDIMNYDDFKENEGTILSNIDEEGLRGYLSKIESIDSVLESLSEKELITTTNDFVYITDKCKNIFNPGKICDCILVVETSDDDSIFSSIYVLTDGYLLLTTVTYGDAMVNELITCPGDTPVEELMKLITKSSFRCQTP